MPFLVNTNRTYNAIPNGPWVPGNTQLFSFVSNVSQNLKMSGAFAVKSETFTALGCQSAASVFVTGAGAISSSQGTKVKSGGVQIMTSDDAGECNGIFTSNTGASIPCNCRIVVLSPGQTRTETKT